MTTIEWTRGDDGSEGKSWNPLRGCTRVSQGCENCYAERVAARFSGHGKPYEGLAEMTSKGPRWTRKVRFVEDALTLPLRWKKPARVFVNSMSDLFHEDVPDEWIDRIFAVMALAPQHTFMVLTKRPERMRTYIRGLAERHSADGNMRLSPQTVLTETAMRGKMLGNIAVETMLLLTRTWPLKNCWLGVSVEDQARADERIPILLDTPAAVGFISAEPLLGPVNIDRLTLAHGEVVGRAFGPGIDTVVLTLNALAGAPKTGIPALNWVIVGGESGPNSRPCDLAWIRSIVGQCKAAGVPCFVKQLGSCPKTERGLRDRDGVLVCGYPRLHDRKGGDTLEWPPDLRVREWPA